ncbi:hypothetical protein Pmar_PMAR014460 [Perkinsus marinus ATCC 50983]|uniref:Uncharacterized protein n=1 Tax=Perkinsus marinus (strain ATCC 50983 / TXsc) TaxID=423536 RepID=C5K9B4_PERM5|nr:hypothetical protein Pmar_PMAR014460 [Perkinsus marinus ATCC 50983]EER18932.1 hypothetical protein Pmar_PMAR014460 [Perkinsus marinus ATCC 50983]|eukprot:XP_002787136.1 hypothetical protein Pmar_PMAR014460 [Perkinsus marinus ATCC 50983]
MAAEVAEVCSKERGLKNPTTDVWKIGMTGVRGELLRPDVEVETGTDEGSTEGILTETAESGGGDKKKKMVTESRSVHLNFEPIRLNVSYHDIRLGLKCYQLLMKDSSSTMEEEDKEAGPLLALTDGEGVEEKQESKSEEEISETTPSSIAASEVEKVCTVYKSDYDCIFHRLNVTLVNDSGKTTNTPFVNILFSNCQITHNNSTTDDGISLDAIDSDEESPREPAGGEESTQRRSQEGTGVLVTRRASIAANVEVAMQFFNPVAAFLKAFEQNMREFGRVWNDERPLGGRSEGGDKLQYAPYSIRNLSGSQLLVTWETHDHEGRSKEPTKPVRIGVGEERRLTDISVHVATNNARMAKDRAFVSLKGDGWEQEKIPLDRKGKYLYYVDDGTVTDVVGFEPYAIIEPAGGGGRQR